MTESPGWPKEDLLTVVARLAEFEEDANVEKKPWRHA